MASNLDLILQEKGPSLIKRLKEDYGKAIIIRDPEKYEKIELIKKVALVIGKEIGARAIDLIEVRLVPQAGVKLTSIEDGEFFTLEKFFDLAKTLDPELSDKKKLNKHPLFYEFLFPCYTDEKSIYYKENESDKPELHELYFENLRGPPLRILKDKKPYCACKNKEYMENLIKEDIERGALKSFEDLINKKLDIFIKNEKEECGRTLTPEEAINDEKFWRTYCAISVPILGKDENGIEYVMGLLSFSDFEKWDFEPISDDAMKILEGLADIIQPILSNAYLAHQWKIQNKKLKEAQEIIVRTRAQAEYAKFSEQVNHQINTLLLGVIPGIEHLNESIRNYNQNFSKFFSEGVSKEEREMYFNLENLVSEIASSVKPLTGLSLLRAKNRAREIFSKHNLNLDELIDKYTEMQLPEDVGEQLIGLTSKYGESVFNSIYYLFDIKHSLSTIKTSTRRIASLVSAIRDYTFGGQAQNYDLIKGLESTLIVMEVKLGGVVITKQYEGKKLPKITCYPGALDQVWTNIINNAVEAGAKNILIDVYMKDEEHIAVKIENDGPQIPPEVIPKIFDKYYSTKKTQNEGTGLGLYMSKEIIEKQHSGSINVYSDPERTYFEVILPIKI